MANPITELFSLPIDKNEIAFMYFGFSSIVLRTKDTSIAIDLCNICLDDKDQIKDLENLDLQINTHTHRDHFDLETTSNIFKVSGAKVVADPQVTKKLEKEIPTDNLKALTPGEKFSINDLEISAVRGVHPVSITLFKMKWPDFSIFHGGDSGYILLKEYPADLAFLPTGAPSPSCSPENALKMTLDIRPKVVVTMHGNEDQMQKFKTIILKEMPDLKVIIPKMKEPIKIIL
ncbi:MAG: MBL fold metallo-hydrolase [Candidatus Hodarchaeota archaeon]